MRPLAGRVALVTGASRGIGRATAERLAAEGANVIVNYTGGADRHFDGGAAGRVVDAIRAQGVQAIAYDADVSDRAAVQEMVHAAEAAFDKIDILVNNAGIGLRQDIVTMPEDAWDRVLDVNLKGQFLVTQAVIPGMIQRRSGRIVNIASELALIGNEERTAYCASKAGVIGFTKALAREMAPYGILVNCIAPGPVDTDMLRRNGPSEEYRESLPLKRFGAPREIAAAVYFLVSPDTTWTTGQVFSPNGGAVI
jgi:NAD(P)-dependent dehydrogenase (short-subunit alcohol dehydrogenase family)